MRKTLRRGADAHYDREPETEKRLKSVRPGYRNHFCLALKPSFHNQVSV
jgi:hypothetical protein